MGHHYANPSVRSDISERKLAERVQCSGESYMSYIEDALGLCRRFHNSMAENDRIRHRLKDINSVAFNALPAKHPTTVADISSTCQRVDNLHLIRLQPDVPAPRAMNDSELRTSIRFIIREELQPASCSLELRRHLLVVASTPS